VPAFEPRIPAGELRPYWQMLAHNQGQMLNAAQLRQRSGREWSDSGTLSRNHGCPAPRPTHAAVGHERKKVPCAYSEGLRPRQRPAARFARHSRSGRPLEASGYWRKLGGDVDRTSNKVSERWLSTLRQSSTLLRATRRIISRQKSTNHLNTL
jgi:hypothetical protein